MAGFLVYAAGTAANARRGSSRYRSTPHTSTPSLPVEYKYVWASEEEADKTPAAVAERRNILANALLAASETIRTFVDEYIEKSQLSADFTATFETRASHDTEWSKYDAGTQEAPEPTVNAKLDAAFVDTIPMRQYRIKVAQSATPPAQLFEIQVGVFDTFVSASNSTMGRQIRACLYAKKNLKIPSTMYTFFNPDNPRTFSEIPKLPATSYKCDDLLWMCDVGVVKSACVNAVVYSKTRSFTMIIRIKRMGKYWGHCDVEKVWFEGKLRAKLGAPFLGATLEWNHPKEPEIREFATVSEFFTWVTTIIHIQSNTDAKPFMLTKNPPSVLSTVLRMLDMIEQDVAFAPQS